MLHRHRFRKWTSLLLVLLLTLSAAPSYAHAWGFPVLRFLGRVGLGAVRGVGWLGLNAFRGIRWLLGGRFFGYPAAASETAFAYPGAATDSALGAQAGATGSFASQGVGLGAPGSDAAGSPAEAAEGCPNLVPASAGS